MIYIVEDDSSIRELEQYACNPTGTRPRAARTRPASGRRCAAGGPTSSFWTSCCPTRTATRFWPSCAPTRPAPQRRSSWSRPKPARSTSSGAGPRCGRLPVQAVRHHGVHLPRAGRAAPRHRCRPAPAASTLRFGDIVLDDVSRTVQVGGVPVELTFKEYALLHLFLEHPEEVLARERIMKDVWDTDDLLESAPSICTCAPCARSWARRARPSAPCARWATS